MKTFYYSIVSVFMSMMLIVGCSCVNTNSSEDIYESDDDYEWGDEDSVMEPDVIDCPLCNATGRWLNPMTGMYEQCAMCRGTGKAPREIGEKVADFFNEIGGNGASSSTSVGGDVDDIMRQIDMCNNQIEQIQQFLDISGSVVNQAYYSQEIIRLEYKVRELERSLMYMQQ